MLLLLLLLLRTLLLTRMLGISNSSILTPTVGRYSPPTLSVASDRKLAIMVLPAWLGPATTIFTLYIAGAATEECAAAGGR